MLNIEIVFNVGRRVGVSERGYQTASLLSCYFLKFLVISFNFDTLNVFRFQIQSVISIELSLHIFNVIDI